MININLLPKDQRRASGPDYWKLGAGAFAGVAVLTMVILQTSVSGTLSGLNRQIEEHQSEIAVLKPQVDERNRLQAEKTKLESVTSVANTLKAGQTSWSDDLARFVRQLPSGDAPVVALSSLSMRAVDAGAQQAAAQNGLYDGKAVSKEVQLSGKARSSAALVQFVNAFEQAPDFGVQFQNMQREQAGGQYSFSATVGMVGAQAENVRPTGTSGAQAGAPQATAPQAPTDASAANAGGSR
ncbi:hypothetical protein [Deinococcus peraridilitoris]|uniref:PilN biogenesis protein dimerization domain-containing protein n=1 Tax=Deinococcus peraridilitoris (strain DSM 19664 / LMG 22246 / CIP 109416 / KR-200) TaxID=937777 RepID=L0A7T1_DEIPD|nr:hypothetical protein [Deinococcus peraridilitoris]AFZ69237.1 hypothetical protein Deipe_3813 [Deinococcus peraridilitoris DSM 19664]